MPGPLCQTTAHQKAEQSWLCLTFWSWHSQVHLEGVIRDSEKPSSFVPDNSPSKAEWYWLDVPAMAKAAGLPPDTPMIEVGVAVSQDAKACLQRCRAPLNQPCCNSTACYPALQSAVGSWYSFCMQQRSLPSLHGSAECSKTKKHDSQAAEVLRQVVKPEVPGMPQVNLPTTMEVLAGRTRGPSSGEEYPIPRNLEDLMNFSVMPSDHRNYALTWYSLSVATALLALQAARTR